MDPMLIDSNGVGGYHVWVLLDKEYPLADTYDFADELRRTGKSLACRESLRSFRRSEHVETDDLPYTLRLPGRHHTRPYYSRLWNFDPMGENEWLEGGEAIEAMLATKTAPLPKVKKRVEKASVKTAVAAGYKRNKTAAQSKKRKPRVCLDLDGVLPQVQRLGRPRPDRPPHSRCSRFRVVACRDGGHRYLYFSLFARRRWRRAATRLSPRQLRIKIIEWLEKYKFPYSDVYAGQGKPRASVFIDDRAVYCSPQKDKNAFEKALDATKSVLSKTKKDARAEVWLNT